MVYRVSADLIVILHVSFVFFVLLGGLLVWRWPRLIWWHLPAVAWGAFVEFSGWTCPLTPLEDWLRTQSGKPDYAGDFMMHDLLPVLYPDALTHTFQIALGMMVVTLNLLIYGERWRVSRTSCGRQ